MLLPPDCRVAGRAAAATRTTASTARSSEVAGCRMRAPAAATASLARPAEVPTTPSGLAGSRSEDESPIPRAPVPVRRRAGRPSLPAAGLAQVVVICPAPPLLGATRVAL